MRLLLDHGADVNAEMFDIPEDEESLWRRAQDQEAWRQQTQALNAVRRSFRALQTANCDGANCQRNAETLDDCDAETVDDCDNFIYL